MPTPSKIDSNTAGLHIAEEYSLKTLPGENGAPGTPTWYAIDVNSYPDFGAEIDTVSRSPISQSRQNSKGTTTDKNANGGFNADMTMNTLTRFLQGFFFADAREKFSTAPLNGARIAIADVDVDSYNAASGMDSFAVGHLVYASGFDDSANNGLSKVTAATATDLTVDSTLVVDAAPNSDAKVEVCGYEFGVGDAALVVSATQIRMTCTDADTLGLTPGEWVFLGGDGALEQFDNNAPGYARIKTVTATYIDFDETTFPATTEAGGAKTIRMFFGTVIRNELDKTLIKRRSYNLERSLGNDGDGTQSQILVGSVANELTLNVNTADKTTIDLAYVAMDDETRTGTDGLKAGTRVADPGEDAINTSQDAYRSRIAIVDPSALNNPAMFAYVREATITINNNVSGLKAIGTVGSFDTNVGNFDTGGSLTAYFNTVEAVRSITANADVEYNIIQAARNEAFIFDIPLLSLGGGKPDVSKDEAITIPLEITGAKNDKGYTAMFCKLPYVPTVGMPS